MTDVFSIENIERIENIELRSLTHCQSVERRQMLTVSREKTDVD